jgi:hypothetical protein
MPALQQLIELVNINQAILPENHRQIGGHFLSYSPQEIWSAERLKSSLNSFMSDSDIITVKSLRINVSTAIELVISYLHRDGLMGGRCVKLVKHQHA